MISGSARVKGAMLWVGVKNIVTELNAGFAKSAKVNLFSESYEFAANLVFAALIVEE